jgi:electron transfer flavoprotein alpha subunit
MPNTILLIAEVRDGHLRKVSLELVTVAQEICLGLGSAVEVVVMGVHTASAADTMARAGVARVYHVDDPRLENFSPEIHASTLADLVRRVQPTLVLFGATGLGKEISARVAAKLDWGLATDCIAYRFEGGKLLLKRPIYAGKAIATVTPKSLPLLVSIRPNIFPPAGANGSPAPIDKVGLSAAKPRAQVVEKVAKEQTGEVDLAEAKIVISGGRGVKGPEGFAPVHALAKTLGAAVGASRAATDAGWIDYSKQVGQTGKTVAPNLYIACGISGAIQHLAGMSSSKVIVAINKDPDAPIFKVADYGIVGDLFLVLPALDDELKKLLSEK